VISMPTGDKEQASAARKWHWPVRADLELQSVIRSNGVSDVLAVGDVIFPTKEIA